MKQKFTVQLRWILLLLLGVSFQTLNAQTTFYTVNSNNPTSGNNFKNFTELANHFSTNGVSSPVVVNVSPTSGPYNEVVHFGNINGTSPTNTIRINGNGVVVQQMFGPASPAQYTNQYVLKLDGTKYVTIDNIFFRAFDTVEAATFLQIGCSGALLSGGARYDSIINCEFELIKDTTNVIFNSSLRSGIVIGPKSPSSSYYGSGGAAQCYIGNNSIIDNSFFHSNYGIGILDGSDSNIVDGNIIKSRSANGLYLQNNIGNRLTYNEITGEAKSFYVGNKNVPILNTLYGIFTTQAGEGTVIMGNRIHDPKSHPTFNTSFIGIGVKNTFAIATAPSILVANNAIYNTDYSGTIYGAHLEGRGIKFYHNTISVDKVMNTFVASYGIYVNETGVDLRNNIVSITKGARGAKYGLFATKALSYSQQNNFYLNSTQTGNQFYASYLNTTYLTIVTFRTAQPTFEINSPSVDPEFGSPVTGDLSVSNNDLKAKGELLTGTVPLDIQKNVRPAKPTIGAFESVLSVNDMSAAYFVTPRDTFCPSTQPVNVAIVNTGVNTVDSLIIRWSVNGVLQPEKVYKNSLNSIASLNGKYIDTVLIGNVYIPSLTSTVLRAWTYMPNGLADTVVSNDSVVGTFEAQAAEYHISADLKTTCPSYGVVLNVQNFGNFPITGYSWEYSYNQQNWVSIPNSDTNHFKNTNIPMSRWYRARVHTATGICTSDSLVFVKIIDPKILSTKSAGTCDSGQLTLSATSQSGTVIRWYDTMSLTNPLKTGNSYTTPVLTGTKTYYVSAQLNGLLGCESPMDSVKAIIEKTPANLKLWDTTFCAGPSVTITARDTGKYYMWNTMETVRSINVRDTGVYVVAITSKYGCVHNDSFRVNFKPEATVASINFAPSYYPSLGTIKFSPEKPKNVTTYSWDFGDGAASTLMSPSHSYAATGNYYVTLTVENECRQYSISQNIHVNLEGDGDNGTGINERDLNNQITLYPNPAEQFITIKSTNSIALEKVSVYDVLGKTVIEINAYKNAQTEINVGQLASGFYTVRITTANGDVLMKKFEVRK